MQKMHQTITTFGKQDNKKRTINKNFFDVQNLWDRTACWCSWDSDIRLKENVNSFVCIKLKDEYPITNLKRFSENSSSAFSLKQVVRKKCKYCYGEVKMVTKVIPRHSCCCSYSIRVDTKPTLRIYIIMPQLFGYMS